MGIVRTEVSKREEIEEFGRMLLSCVAVHRKKDEEEFKDLRVASREIDEDEGDKVVCVTSGVSYLGRAVVNRLLLRGYSVRIMVDNQEDMEKLREMETSGEMAMTRSEFKAVVAKLSDVESLRGAFEGCRGVFHTSAFADPAGLTGYSKFMAELEVKACENVMEACAMTPSVRKCVLTSSLLASVWQDTVKNGFSHVINHEHWSKESVCIDKKLWYALGKLRAEKAAYKIAEQRGLKLTSICPGLITGPDFINKNPTATIAYLKGAKEMYANGLLATVDGMRVADAHVSVYEGMNKTAYGRYICFDQVIDSEDKATKLAQDMGMPTEKIRGDVSFDDFKPNYELSNKKLSCLLSRTLRDCYNESESLY